MKPGKTQYYPIKSRKKPITNSESNKDLVITNCKKKKEKNQQVAIESVQQLINTGETRPSPSRSTFKFHQTTRLHLKWKCKSLKVQLNGAKRNQKTTVSETKWKRKMHAGPPTEKKTEIIKNKTKNRRKNVTNDQKKTNKRTTQRETLPITTGQSRRRRPKKRRTSNDNIGNPPVKERKRKNEERDMSNIETKTNEEKKESNETKQNAREADCWPFRAPQSLKNNNHCKPRSTLGKRSFKVFSFSHLSLLGFLSLALSFLISSRARARSADRLDDNRLEPTMEKSGTHEIAPNKTH